MFLAGCVSTVTRYYLPNENNPRFDTTGAAHTLSQYLQVQCPERRAAQKPERGDVRITIVTDTAGAVTRSELESSTGDEVLDGVFGTVAAQLQVDSLRAVGKPTATRHLRVAHNCAPDSTRATLEVVRP